MNTKSVLNRNLLFGTSVFVLLIIPYTIVYFQNPVQRTNFTVEDGIIENLSSIFFLLASIVYLVLFFKSSSKEEKYFLKAKKNYFFLLLGLLFFFCFGEEISWGERILNLTTPSFWNSINAQGETNIHNLYIFQGNDHTHVVKTGIAVWFTAQRMFLLFCLFYCVIIPIVNLLSAKQREICQKIYFPIVPIWLGILFFINQVICSALGAAMHLKDLQPVVEIKETNFGFLFFIVGVYFYSGYKNTSGQVKMKKAAEVNGSQHRFSLRF